MEPLEPFKHHHTYIVNHKDRLHYHYMSYVHNLYIISTYFHIHFVNIVNRKFLSIRIFLLLLLFYEFMNSSYNSNNLYITLLKLQFPFIFRFLGINFINTFLLISKFSKICGNFFFFQILCSNWSRNIIR